MKFCTADLCLAIVLEAALVKSGYGDYRSDYVSDRLKRDLFYQGWLAGIWQAMAVEYRS